MDASDILALCKRRGFIWPAFEIYGGVAGMYDYGPLGIAMKNNIIDIWRKAYTLGEGFIEIDGPTIGPEIVFKASGHVDAFSDSIVSCKQCKESFRADHLAKGLHSNPDSLSNEELSKLLTENEVKCPECGGELTDVEDFNLMFKTTIGPGAGRLGYLRPETAQNIFVNYLQLYRYAREKLPFGAIQIGRGYRNEISPRQGVIRLREFNMMEAELFVDPENKTWPRFDKIKNEKMKLVPNNGEEIEISVGEAVEKHMIGNATLAYFMYFTQEFLKTVGIDPERLRFRQHLQTEMAHYASDCWDAEVLLSYGWTEVVGIADRGCWDLSRHIEFSNADLTAFKKYDEPVEIEKEVIKPKYELLGPKFKGKSAKIGKALEETDPSKIKDGKIAIDVDGETITIGSEFFEVIRVKEKVTGKKIVPHVIEPSHGLDRIFYACLEHAYTQKSDGYVVLRLKPAIAPIKVGVFPLMAKDGLDVKAAEIDERIRMSGITSYYDDSGSIGRRYARMDEIGTPWCITVDYQTLKDGTVTIRDRDTTKQVRIHEEKIVQTINSLLCGTPFSALEQ
ncbi:MAG: glycine--tRNA ligase [Methanomassiliicoccales archaeon]|nr:glycine--tRNA ligase [Methanomassiliicoccales archaeon]